MKKGIHPEYVECTVNCGCGNSFVTRAAKPRIAVEICSKCHPFYTGKAKLVDSTGRVERFQRRWAGSGYMDAATRSAEKPAAQTEAPVEAEEG